MPIFVNKETVNCIVERYLRGGAGTETPVHLILDSILCCLFFLTFLTNNTAGANELLNFITYQMKQHIRLTTLNSPLLSFI